MSWLSVFFKKDNVKVFLNLALNLLKLLLGGIASNLSTIAQEEVAKAEASGKNGDDKYTAAFAGIKAALSLSVCPLGNFSIPPPPPAVPG